MITPEARKRMEEAAKFRVNIGCGEYPLLYWTNLDADPNVKADIHATVPPLPFESDSLVEIFAGHFLEHLTPQVADVFMSECKRVLKPGGRLGIVVPDTREVVKRYLRAANDAVEYPYRVWHSIADMDTLCRLFFYSTVQESRHQWSYDTTTLKRLFENHGFQIHREIDRYRDPRIPQGAWYQCGWDGIKPQPGGER